MTRNPSFEELEELEPESSEHDGADGEDFRNREKGGFFSLDAEWRFVYVNPVAERMLGISRAEVLGRSFWELFPLKRGTRLEREYRRAAAGDVRDFENLYKPLNRWFHTTCYPVSGGGISVYFRDITGRKRVEETLRESEKKYRALFETGSDAMVLAEVGTGRILDANEVCTAIYGYNRDELLKMTVMDLSSEPEEARKAVERRAQRIPLRYHRKKDGSLFPVDIIVNDLQLQGREVRIAAIRDITGQKQVEEVLRESEERARRSAEVNRTMAELGRIITSSLHIDGIYEQFAGAVRRVVPFDRLTIGIINAEQNTFFYQHTIGLDLPGRKKGDCVPLPPIVAEAVHKRASVLVHADDQGFARGYPMLPVLFKIGIRSAISAPIFSRDEVIGALLFFSLAPNAYTEDHLRLAEGMARQISGTIANSLLLAERQRSEERARRAAEVNRTMAEIGRIISSSLSIDEVYEQFAGAVKKIIPLDRLRVSIITPGKKTCFIAHTSGIDIPGRRKGEIVPVPPFLDEMKRKRSGILIQADDERTFREEYPFCPLSGWVSDPASLPP